MTSQPIVAADVRRVTGDRVADRRDLLAVEEPLEIRVVHGGKEPRTEPLTVTMRTPGNDVELAAGFALTEGLVRKAEDIDHIAYSADCPSDEALNILEIHLAPGVEFDASLTRRHFLTTSACGVCGKASLDALRSRGVPSLASGTPRVPRQLVPRLADTLRRAQAVFEATGGLHAAGLFEPDGRPRLVREDVGRHNAVDKVLGREFLEGRTPLADALLVVSGRAGFEIVQKAAVAGVPVLVAVGAPSSLAVEVAKEFGMTLVGFARGDSFNVYSGSDRIVEDGAPRVRSRARGRTP